MSPEHSADLSRLDPDMANYVRDIEDSLSNAHELTAPELRDLFNSLRLPPATSPNVNQIDNIDVPANHGNIACRLYKPTTSDQLPILIWFHGGGWVLGDLDSADYPCRDLAVKSGCAVLSVNYRLAPENQFPAAFDDCIDVVQWVFENPQAISADTTRVAVGGDSAGGNLAACTAIAARDHALPIMFQLLIYPVIETLFDNKSYLDNSAGYLLSKELMVWFWDEYAPDKNSRNDARLQPLQAGLNNLPPTWILTCDHDPLRDEGLKYANALSEAGVPVFLRESRDTVHGFFTMPLDVSARARSEAAQALKQAFV